MIFKINKNTHHCGVELQCTHKGYEEFCLWPPSDLQTKESVDLVLGQIDLIERSVMTEICSDGNTWVAMIKPNGISLVDLHSEEKSMKTLSLEQSKALLLTWRQALKW